MKADTFSLKALLCTCEAACENITCDCGNPPKQPLTNTNHVTQNHNHAVDKMGKASDKSHA